MNTMPRTAFVLCAGMGTRLRPLTASIPKPLVPICGIPLVEFALSRIIATGVERIVINTHHLPEKFRKLFPNYPNKSSYENVPVFFRHEDKLLDTAGGLKNVEDLLLPGAVLIYNGDIFADIDLQALVEAHISLNATSTLALRSSGEEMRISFNLASNAVTDLRGELKASDPRFLYAGICVIEQSLLQRIPAGIPLSLVHVWLDEIRNGRKVAGVVLDDNVWRDIGNLEEYKRLHEDLVSGSVKITPPANAPDRWPFHGKLLVHNE